METFLNRRQLLICAGVRAVGAGAAIGTAPAPVIAAEDTEQVEGGWYVTVQVLQPSLATFDALYSFAKGGVFTRIDGRNNAPALGSWNPTEDGGIIFSNILFNFTAGVRTGYITGKFAARVVNETLVGTFTAEGHGIPGFLPRSGTFTGTRIVAETP